VGFRRSAREHACKASPGEDGRASFIEDIGREEEASMTSESTTLDAAERASPGWPRMARLFLPLMAIALLAAAAQIYWGANPDTSYGLTEAEKMLDGQRPYVDFLELNPPLLFLLPLGPTLVARFIGATPELLFDLFCFGAAGFSLWLSWSVLVGGGVARASGARFVIVAAVVLLLLPARAFAQREHIALITALPCVAALAVWSARGQAPPLFSILAGLGAGVTLSIKPHFALFFLLPFFYLVRRAGWRAAVIRIELQAALAVVVLFWISTIVWFPAFLERMAPMTRDIYLPARMPVATLLHDPVLIDLGVFGALLAFAPRKRWAEPLIAVPALASLGAMATYLIQGKLWPNHGYPAIAFAALALGPLVLESLTTLRDARDAKMQLAIAAACAITIALGGYWLSTGVDAPELERAVAAIGPHPKVLAISPFVQTGHPLTRRVHGVWVGSVGSLWITDMASRALESSPIDAGKQEKYLRLDRETLAADIVNRKPDAILIAGNSWLAWAQSHPDVAAALAEYHLRETADHTMVYARNDANRLVQTAPLNSGSDPP
jgi:hypothetical protein